MPITQVSLKSIGGIPCVVWNGFQIKERRASRDALSFIDEEIETPRHKSASDLTPSEGLDGYLRLPNILTKELESPQQLMLTCEGFERPIIKTWIAGADLYRNAVEVSDKVKPLELLDGLGTVNNKRTMRDRSKKAIDLWCYEGDISAAIPVKDIVSMSNDLKALITLLIYSRGGACKPEVLKKNVPSMLAMFECEPGCYTSHIASIPPWLMRGGTGQMASWYASAVYPIVKSASETGHADPHDLGLIADFCDHIITALMSDLVPRLTDDGFFPMGEFASLGGAYAYWANEAVKDKAAVCETCGALFIRKKCTGRFCGGACRERSHSSKK